MAANQNSNIVFIGCSKFGLRCLELLKNMEGVEVSGVVSAPKTFPISYRKDGDFNNVLHGDISTFCSKNNLKYVSINNGMKDSNLLETVKSWNPSFFIVVGWYHLLPKEWMDLAPAYGLHASLLPNYSGGAPLVWALINGEKKTGITLFQMDQGVDSGPVVGQLEEIIEDDDTIASLYARIEERGIELLRLEVPKLISGSYVLSHQDESQRKTYPQRNEQDGEIDWSWDAQRIRNFIRAQTKPYPGAFFYIEGKKVTLWDADVL
jgi:methionyl-tRNA formyltransferase